ncbi:hypothetical protein HGB07_09115 [Candidatus Roizmanbacteria bacterium]|nr:hypothetical protein [Candidatus Roizmanbacteria bacterium]
MTLDEFIDFLEPTDTRGGAVCMSGDDWTALKTAIEQLCRRMGNKCTYEMRQIISLHFNKSNIQ